MGVIMAWTSKARQWALWKRVQDRASKQKGCACVVRRVAERGGGLGRAARILNDLDRPTMRVATARGMASVSGGRGSRYRDSRRTWASTWRAVNSCQACRRSM